MGVSVAYSLFNGGAVSAALARSVSTARSAAERARSTELEVAGEVDRGLSAIMEADARIESLATALARFDEVSRIERLRLETGVGTEADYVRAEADRLAAEANLIVARYADEWNLSGGSPDEFRRKSAIIDGYCREIGRDPAEIERSVQFQPAAMQGDVVATARAYLEAGATHLIFTCPVPYSAEGARWLWHDVVQKLR